MKEKEVVEAAIDYIENNLDSDLTLEDVANKTGYSKFHLNRIFSKAVGQTIGRYIHERRLTEAARDLVETDKPIIDIALEANYQSQQAFNYAFKKVYYIPPQVFRRIGIFEPKKLPHKVISLKRFYETECVAA